MHNLVLEIHFRKTWHRLILNSVIGCMRLFWHLEWSSAWQAFRVTFRWNFLEIHHVLRKVLWREQIYRAGSLLCRTVDHCCLPIRLAFLLIFTKCPLPFCSPCWSNNSIWWCSFKIFLLGTLNFCLLSNHLLNPPAAFPLTVSSILL